MIKDAKFWNLKNESLKQVTKVSREDSTAETIVSLVEKCKERAECKIIGSFWCVIVLLKVQRDAERSKLEKGYETGDWANRATGKIMINSLKRLIDWTNTERREQRAAGDYRLLEGTTQDYCWCIWRSKTSKTFLLPLHFRKLRDTGQIANQHWYQIILILSLHKF